MLDQAALRDHLAAAYAAGALSPGLALLTETQAALLPDAALRVALAESAAGALLEMERPAALSADALERTLAAIAHEEAAALEIPARARRAMKHRDEIERLPAPVRAAALAALDANGWTFSAFGVSTLDLPIGDDAKVELIRIAPGVATPRHTHEGAELTLVVTGAFRDERGRYGVGEIAAAGPHVTHTPKAEAGEVCYNLAISEAPLKFTGLLGALQRAFLN
ncbi:MAG: ChrR family anti-sigma-E factor [Hyphomonadaceae bacterium]